MPNEKNKPKVEIRTTPGALKIREITREDGTTEESRTITGTAIVFNQESQVLDPNWDPFVEVIKPEAATMEFLNTQDIKLNLLHDRSSTIGRSNKGVGNLKLSVDDNGVNFEIEAPKCDLGDQALEMVRNGVYSGCSFEFYPKDYQIEEIKDAEGNDLTKVTVTAFESITALTIAMDPAYTQTEVNARELREKTPQAVERRKEESKRLAREREVAKAEAFLREREIETFNNF